MALLSVAASALFIFSVSVALPGTAQKLTQSVAEALVVAVIVSLAVEPRLLRFFGEEIASQTFWTSFYSRAPDTYREAIKELASAERFAIYVEWQMTFDWVDQNQSAIKLSIRCNNHMQNRGSKAMDLKPSSFVYESAFRDLQADFTSYVTVCQESEFCSDLFREGKARKVQADDGRILVLPDLEQEQPYFSVPPGQRYTLMTAATSYVGPMGHFPLVLTSPALKCAIQLTGTALEDLYISIFASRPRQRYHADRRHGD